MDFIPRPILELIAIVGLGGVIALIFAMAFYVVVRAAAFRANAQTRQINASTQQEEIVNSMVVRFDNDIRLMREQHATEIRDVREKHDALQNQFHATDKELAREQGRRDQMEKQINQQNEQLQKQGGKITELEKHYQASQLRVSELEAQIELLEKQLAAANADNDVLKTEKRELEAQLEIEKNRALGLSERLTQREKEILDATQIIPDIQDVDDTLVPALELTPSTIAAEVAAETETDNVHNPQ